MIESMTGYGRFSAASAAGTVTAEIKTVNSRFLELNFRCDGVSAAGEDAARQKIKESISRGKAYISLSFNRSKGGKPVRAALNAPLLEEQIRVLREAQSLPGVKKEKLRVADLLALPAPWIELSQETISEEEAAELAGKAMEGAIAELKAMRRREGAALAEDLKARIEFLRGKLSVLKDNQEAAAAQYEERLRERIRTLLEGTGFAPDEGRILEEVAVFAEKTDYTEELVRFESHLTQFTEAIEGSGPAGRKLDFLLQEINREVNTMASKANDLTVVDTVIAVKAELEKVREQVQNLE